MRMCGIVGYIGQAGDSRDYFALDVVLEGALFFDLLLSFPGHFLK